MSGFSKVFSVVVLSVMVLIGGQPASADDPIVLNTDYQIGYFLVQPRKYESGREINRAVFEILDAGGHYASGPVDIASVELIFPDNDSVLIDPSVLTFYSELSMTPAYDGSTGQYNYDMKAFEYQSGYYFDIDDGDIDWESLPAGNFQLIVKDSAGNVHDQFFAFNEIVDLPVIPRSSIKYKIDTYGNLISTWDVPYYLDVTLETSVRALIEFSKDGEYVGVLHVKIPTHMGTLFVPANVVDQMQGLGDEFEMRIQLRTNDNNNRTYSDSRKLNQLKAKGHGKGKENGKKK